MGKIINLRHLINYGTFALSYMPKGIERLVFLRTLSKLVVGGDGDGHNSQECSLDCLKKLDYLRGSLVIRGLGNVIDGAEAKNANLRSKKYLHHLELYFDCKPQMTCLRLDRFVVGGGPNDMGLGCLKNLNKLRGELWLEGLGEVVDEAEAKNAQLMNKKNL
ncbi:hypothetical protein LWI28_025372 [Acer negundo]|uniref:R13L1/DRL21-like LRR repeat region domain-containing protein n=1 Tax=Acer negundo TaxID=4023 RepID=A0AAD5NJS8_ACENE|nr:hypothetical protein LWI28_025372 [Acer negundo]